MTGSLHEKNGHYHVVLSYKDSQGKHRTKWVSTGLSVKNNKRKAELLMAEIVEKYSREEITLKSDMYFTDLARVWLTSIEASVDEISFQGYENILNKQIIPYFEERKIKLTQLSTDVFQNYINEKSKHGRIKDGGPLSPTTIKHHRKILNFIVKEGMRRDIIQKNCLEFVRIPKQIKREPTFYTVEQIEKLLNAIRDEPLYPLIYFTIIFGLRRSEVLGLKWDSIDFEKNTVTIKHTVVSCTSVVHKDSTKSDASYRHFPMTEEIRGILIGLRAEEDRYRQLCGSEYKDNDYIFKWPDGELYNPDAVTRKFGQLLEKHNLPPIRFHDLRHSCASLLVSNGFELKDIQEWLGHSDVRVTANIYAHLDCSRKQHIADKMSSTFAY